jgi:hypothetical protein
MLGRIVPLDDGVPGGMEVFVGVSIGRIVTAAYVPAGPAQPQVHPGAARFQTLLAPQGARRYGLDATQV